MNSRKKKMSRAPPPLTMNTGKKKSFQMIDRLLQSLGPLSLLTYGGTYLYGVASEVLSFYPSDLMKNYFPRNAEPGFYIEIGKMSRDLLFEDYTICSKISLDKYPFSASLAHTHFNGITLGKVNYHSIYKSVTTDVTLCTNSSVAIKSTINQIAYGLIPGLSFASFFDSSLPNSLKIEVQFMHDYAAFKASIGGLFHNTNVGISPVIGTKFLSFGMDMVVQTNTQNFTKCDASFAYTSPEKRTSSLALIELGKVLTASYYQCIDSNTSIGAQFKYHFIDRRSILTLGLEHKFDGITSLKAKADSTGQLNIIFKRSCFKVVGELRANQFPRIGLGIALSF